VIAVLLLLLAVPPYSRAQWPHWQGGCLDVREQVLIAESRQPVTKSADGCTLVWGDWLDPYTGEQTNDPHGLDCDHLIPLKAAHVAGGWRWTRAEKAAYANDQTDPDHLIATRASVNRQKGSKGPSQWLPPRLAYRCHYVAAYAHVAEVWHLTLPKADVRTIRTVRGACQ